MRSVFPHLQTVLHCEDVEQCLGWNRFLPSPENVSEVEVINAVVKRLGELRTQDNDAYVRASKRLGWGR